MFELNKIKNIGQPQNDLSLYLIFVIWGVPI